MEWIVGWGGWGGMMVLLSFLAWLVPLVNVLKSERLANGFVASSEAIKVFGVHS